MKIILKFGLASFLCVSLLSPVLSREFYPLERAIFNQYEKTQEVFRYSIEQIDTSRLSWGEWAQYQVLRRSCRLVEAKFDQIQEAPDDFPNQYQNLGGLYAACSEGTLSLVRLYISQQ